MDPVNKSNNELKDATKAAVQRILSNKTPSRSKPQIITRDIAGLRRELEDVLEQTAKHRTDRSIKYMEIRRGAKAYSTQQKVLYIKNHRTLYNKTHGRLHLR